MPYILFLLFCLMLLFSGSPYAASYEEGNQAYLDKNYELALKIMKPLAEQGHSQAQITMGLLYEHGQGVQKDPVESTKWYLMAAEQGEAMVQHFVGIKYFQGEGVEQDYFEAAKWWERSAKSGIVDSQFNLGLMYYKGFGIEKDYTKAGELFEAAAEQGHDHAQYSLGVMYAFGQGEEREKDYKTALKWFKKSADQGFPQAQYNLGVFHENGYGISKNLNEAKNWYQLAAAQDLQEAIKKLATLKETASQTASNTQPPPTEAITKEKAAFVTSTISEPPTASGDDELNLTTWLRKQSPDSYTLQLASVVNRDNIIKYIKESKLGPKAGYVEVIVQDINRYSAIYGLYRTYQNAELAIKTLPEVVQKTKPWIRNTKKIQGLLR